MLIICQWNYPQQILRNIDFCSICIIWIKKLASPWNCHFVIHIFPYLAKAVTEVSNINQYSIKVFNDFFHIYQNPEYQSGISMLAKNITSSKKWTATVIGWSIWPHVRDVKASMSAKVRLDLNWDIRITSKRSKRR